MIDKKKYEFLEDTQKERIHKLLDDLYNDRVQEMVNQRRINFE